MAITGTTLSADLSATGLTMTVASGTGFPTSGASTPQSNYLVRIDKEFMLAVLQPVANTIKLAQRGYNGTVAAAHDLLSYVEVSSNPGDFANPPSGQTTTLPAYIPDMQTLGEDYTFTAAEIAAYGNQARDFVITKATAIAVTLVAPSKAQDGLVLTFTSDTAALHVITATSLFASGGTSSPYTTATASNTKAGSTMVLKAYNALWTVVSLQNWALT
jgi:hypothetical protein